jgi:hypothetical protein
MTDLIIEDVQTRLSQYTPNMLSFRVGKTSDGQFLAYVEVPDDDEPVLLGTGATLQLALNEIGAVAREAFGVINVKVTM